MPYLDKRALSGLKDYVYKPAGYTPIDGFHQPIWNYVAEQWLPRWLAPNLITLTGLSALIISYSIISAETPDFEHPAPSWVYLMAACAVFFYLHMDALDGKQARRTKTSSPLGQLFDHGCDALAVHLILTVMLTSLQLGHEWKAIVSYMYVCIPWWMAHWEEYHTGVMSYGNGLWGVTEANYAVVLLHAFTYTVGPSVWTARPFALILKEFPHIAEHVPPTAVKFLISLRGNDCFMIFFFFLGASLFQDQVRRVFKMASLIHSRKSSMTKKERGNKTLGPKAAAFHLFQILFTCVCGAALMLLPTTVPGEARVLMATFGVTYALQATRLIMAHMSKEPFSVAAWPLVLMLIPVANNFVHVVDPVLLAYAVNSIVIVGYLHYVVGMTNEICVYLGIKALTIKPAMD